MLDTTTGSSSGLALVKAWLDNCLQNHKGGCVTYCHAGEEPLPTRVIDVGPPDSGQDPLLVTTNGMAAPYVALSHCWGKSNIVTTTKSNLERHQREGIPLQSLPQNFRDSIAITRSLACRYLWIDSLCIVQDSHEDWEVESGRMHLVYRNAIVTISIARSQDPHTGCFTTRDPSLARPFSLSLPLPEPDADDGYNSDGDHTYDNHKKKKKGDDSEDHERGIFWQLMRSPSAQGPLHQRAWVLQEQAFSGRVVSFSEGGVSWSCTTAFGSEYIPCPLSRQDVSGELYDTFQTQIVEKERQHPASTLAGSAKRRRQPYDFWYQVVAEYSGRNLTYATDRLLAVSSLAHEMGRILDDAYVAGLWRQDLVRGLLWATLRHMDHEYRRAHPPLLYVAPSWSWASVLGGGVSFEAEMLNKGIAKNPVVNFSRSEGDLDPEYEYLPEPGDDDIELLDVRCTRAGQNEFGQLSDGTIRLRGLVKDAVIRLPDTLYDRETNKKIGSVMWDETKPPAHLDGQVLRCLFMVKRWYKYSFESSTLQALSLVLISTSLQTNEYRRLGLAVFDAEVEWDHTSKTELVLV